VAGRRAAVRWSVALALAAAVLAGTAGPGPGSGATAGAEEPADPSAPGAALAQLCAASPVPQLPELGPGVCTTVDSGAVLLAAVCAHAGFDPTSCAALTDGRPSDPAAVAAFESGWVARALALQGRLDWDRPLRDALIPHTHNSFNWPGHGPSLTTLDPNQRYSLTDQLRLGFRALELDIHWLPHPAGTPATGGRRVAVCHGLTQPVGVLTVHVGCSVDRLLGPVLEEIRAFLDAPGNEDEVLLLYLQNELDDDPAAHAEAVAELERTLGPLVDRPDPASGDCEDLPVERSRAEVAAAGHRVLLVGDCGSGTWPSWVFRRGPAWNERANTAGYPPFPACAADRAARGYDDHLIRVTEDRTWVSAVAATPAPITAAEVRAMVRCGVELIGLDRVGPEDPRLAELVWSWAPGEPSAAGPCAVWGTDARFRASDCAGARPAACRAADGGWLVPDAATAWAGAFAACAAAGATFDVPRNGWDDERLRAVAPAGAELWLDYGVAAASGRWEPALASPAELVHATPAAGPVAERTAARRALPATGGAAAAPLAAAVALLAAVALRVGRGGGPPVSGQPGRRRP
jgi:hypothetical protein